MWATDLFLIFIYYAFICIETTDVILIAFTGQPRNWKWSNSSNKSENIRNIKTHSHSMWIWSEFISVSKSTSFVNDYEACIINLNNSMIKMEFCESKTTKKFSPRKRSDHYLIDKIFKSNLYILNVIFRILMV